ncbi:MAG: hypothetical protein ACRDRW_07230 [Pseudonocardiaceae bacterium]
MTLLLRACGVVIGVVLGGLMTSDIGHSEGTPGIAALIKVALCPAQRR